MSKAHMLSEHERERLYQGLLQDKTHEEIAQEIGRSWLTVRKWARRFHKQGLTGLQAQVRGRPKADILGTYSAEVRDEALQLKQNHKKWGSTTRSGRFAKTVSERTTSPSQPVGGLLQSALSGQGCQTRETFKTPGFDPCHGRS